jgi:homoserine trans-succinylase
VFPVKINVQKLYSSTLEKIKNEKLDEIRNQNFDGIIITRGSVHEFDVFCFDNRAAIVVGENEGEVGQHE